MQTSYLNPQIDQLFADIARLEHDLHALRNADYERFPANFVNIACGAINKAELLLRSMRQLIPEYQVRDREYMDECTRRNLNISFSQSEGRFSVILPGILPTRTFKHHTNFITQPFYSAISQYAMYNNIPARNRDINVVVFTHVYNEALSRRRVKDFDNLESKDILDILAAFALHDDGGLHIKLMHQAKFGETDATHIDVMAIDDFPFWYADHCLG